MRFLLGSPSIGLVILTSACGSSMTLGAPHGVSDSGGAGSTTHEAPNDAATIDEAAAACITVQRPPVLHIPHVEALGSKAQSVTQAIGAILSAQSPPVDPNASSYVAPDVGCRDVNSPVTVSGYACSLTLTLPGGVSTTVTTNSGSLAQNLATALGTAGATPCNDPAHGTFTRLRNLDATSATVAFDDVSNDDAPLAPNLSVRGADAQGILDALAAANVKDCDPSRDLFLIATTLMSGSPTGGFQWLPFERVGDSWLLNVCTGFTSPGTTPGPTIDGSHLGVLWKAIAKAAQDAAFVPLNGTVSQATVINARSFRWDGTTLSLLLTMDNP